MGGEISIGAIGAALIAGIISLLGLIISKEQKTSEFRQTWVDSLRSEITIYLTSINAIADALLVNYSDHKEKVTALSPLYSKFNEASYAITLRLNPDEDSSKAVLSCMRKFNQLASDESKLVSSNIKPIEIDLLSSSKELLKYEWKRVKRGEPTFWMTKLIAAAAIIGALISIPFIPSGKRAEIEKVGEGGQMIVNNVRNAENYLMPSEAICSRADSRGPTSGKITRARGTHRSGRHATRKRLLVVCKR